MSLRAPLRSAIAAAAVLVLASAFSGAAAPAFAAERPTRAQIAEGLTCQCGCGLTVANCNHPQCSFSVPVRAEIDSMIARGMTSAQIFAFYRHKYGEKVLSAPPAEGFNLLAWTMPFLAVLLGGTLIVIAANRWRLAAPAPSTGAPERDRELDSALKRKLDEEIREQL